MWELMSEKLKGIELLLQLQVITMNELITIN